MRGIEVIYSELGNWKLSLILVSETNRRSIFGLSERQSYLFLMKLIFMCANISYFNLSMQSEIKTLWQFILVRLGLTHDLQIQM